MSATQSPRSLDRAPTASSGKLTLSFRLVFVSRVSPLLPRHTHNTRLTFT
jgi:hypothetical protein